MRTCAAFVHKVHRLRSVRVAGLQPFDPETPGLDQLTDGAIEVAAAGAAHPYGRESILPAPDTGIGRAPMLDEEEAAAVLRLDRQSFRANLEETGMGYGYEVDMIRAARELDLLTAPYVFTREDATAMAEAGADVLHRETPVLGHGIDPAFLPELAALVREHRSTLVFVNTRRLAERVSATLEIGQVVNIVDSLNFSMAIPNLIAVYLLLPELREDLKDYWQRVVLKREVKA